MPLSAEVHCFDRLTVDQIAQMCIQMLYIIMLQSINWNW